MSHQNAFEDHDELTFMVVVGDDESEIMRLLRTLPKETEKA
jgi:hypothetical protein